MRIWLVPFGELDNKRIVAQHHEWHAIKNKIERGHRWKNWELPEHQFEFYLIHGWLVKEMEIRGMTGHQTPGLMDRKVLEAKPVDYPRPREAIQEERFELLARWGGKFKGRATSFEKEWDEVASRWRANGNQCLHERGWLVSGSGRMCPTCKEIRL